MPAWWWQPKLDEQQGGWPFTSVRSTAGGLDVVQMDVEIQALPRQWRGWSLVLRAYIDAQGKTVREGLVLVEPEGDDGA